jgi:tetraacyldisaccharide 4'-kinase
VERWLTSVWYGGAPGGGLLRPLAWVFGLVARLRRVLYRCGFWPVVRAARPVIVVGNLTVGGTGKTPLVAWLGLALREAGYAVVLISRGYGRTGSGVEVVGPESRAVTVGDEALLLARRTGLPVVVGRDRVAAAQRAVELGAELIVADDGLQHLRLGRAVEILVVDGVRGFGSARLLPAGPLREPLSRLASVDAIVVNGPRGELGALAELLQVATPRFRMTLEPEALRPLEADGATRTLASARGERWHAVAGIGHPQRFFSLLRVAGLELIEHPFPDHHPFSAAELDFGDGLPIVMTEKDAVKCAGLGIAPAWYLPVSAALEEGDALLACIAARLAAATA